MNRVFQNKTVGSFMVLWVLLFSFAGAGDLVICLGENGHLALEQAHIDASHLKQDCTTQDCSPAGCSGSGIDCDQTGDCTDSSVSSFFGKLGSRRIDNLHQVAVAHLGDGRTESCNPIFSSFEALLSNKLELGSSPTSSIDFTIIIC